jgi:23S rRNA (adenine2030-N6)-methyltransferase
MNYRHSYHAGCFTDVIKHITLIALLNALGRKEAPYCYIDTHAGIGYYDLFSEFAKKTHAYVNGIEKVIASPAPPPLVQRYLDCVHKINNQLTGTKFSSLRYYPGSPMIARYLIRPHDRIVACELQRQEYEALRTAFAGDKLVAIHHTDGFLGLKAFLPPPERRGLVLIDPPYEDPDEFTRIAHSLPVALKRWETGVFAIWYPIKEKIQVERFYKALKEYISAPIIAVEMTIFPDLANHLNGCGLAVINPPWQFDESIQETLPWLWKALTINGQGGFYVSPLK